MQTAYQILVASSLALLDEQHADLWNTGKVSAPDSSHVKYAGAPLRSRQRAFWTVRAWDRDDHTSAWSAPSHWEMGLLAASDWQADWIYAPALANPDLSHAQWIWLPGDTTQNANDRTFRRVVHVDDDVLAASCLVAADDSFELDINGVRIGASTHGVRVEPTSNARNVHRFQELGLTRGDNTLVVHARDADGVAGLLLALDVALASGEHQTLLSDTTWEAEIVGASAPASDGTWSPAQAVGPFGMPPWGTLHSGSQPALLRKDFEVARTVSSARVYATALGLYELYLNGQRIGVDHLTPGWTDYRKRVQYQTYDVTQALAHGANTLGVMLADGWFSGKVGVYERSGLFGDGPNRLLLQLEVQYSDGSREVLVHTGDDAFQVGTGALLVADLLDGEDHDARLEASGWSEPDFAPPPSWGLSQTYRDGSSRALVADVSDGIRVDRTLQPVRVAEQAPGIWIFDLGQNMGGWARLRVRGKRGAKLVLRFGEVLNPDGSLYVANLRGAVASDSYVLRGDPSETFEPHFTSHGFRYVELSGDVDELFDPPDRDTITGVVAHADIAQTGSFATSSADLNQLQSNIVWGQLGNFMSVPTDCPQRDERVGWMADAHVFARTASFNRDVASFYTKWMRDILDAQAPNGAFSEMAPNPDAPVGTPGWSDAGVIIPWTMYLVYGDTQILADAYDAMSAWIGFIETANPGFLWLKQRGDDFGDWLSVDAFTDKDVIATAFYAHSSELMAKIARILGRTDDAQRFSDLTAKIKRAFAHTFVDHQGRIRSDTQTAYALALEFELLSPELAALAARHLADDVRMRKHLSTGFVGTSHLLPALTRIGRTDLAYQLLNTDSYPSWLYPIRKGATTLWERWDGIEEDGSFEDPYMNSFNHYAFGAVGEWMYTVIAGIELDESAPGYRHFFVQPRPGGALTSAHASLDTQYGTIAVAWLLAGTTFGLHVTVPVGTTATVRLPFAGETAVHGGAPVQTQADGGLLLSSGEYTIEVQSMQPLREEGFEHASVEATSAVQLNAGEELEESTTLPSGD